MIDFKGRKRQKKQSVDGFSLIEVIIALLIMGLSIGTIFRFQSQLMIGTMQSHGFFERLPTIKNMFARAQENTWYESPVPIVVKDEPTDTQLTYEVKKLATGSLAALPNLMLEQVHAEWPGYLAPRTAELITFRFNLPPVAPA